MNVHHHPGEDAPRADVPHRTNHRILERWDGPAIRDGGGASLQAGEQRVGGGEIVVLLGERVPRETVLAIDVSDQRDVVHQSLVET